MVTILDEVHISVKHRPKQRFGLWLVAYGYPVDPTTIDYWQHFVDGMVTKAAEQGWILEYGTAPNEGSFALFRDDLLCPAEGGEP